MIYTRTLNSSKIRSIWSINSLRFHFESSGFATYEGVMDPATAVDGIPTVQPVLEQKIRQAIEGIQAPQTIHSVELQTCFKSYIGFEQSLRDAEMCWRWAYCVHEELSKWRSWSCQYLLGPKRFCKGNFGLSNLVYSKPHTKSWRSCTEESQQDVQIRFFCSRFLSFHIKSWKVSRIRPLYHVLSQRPEKIKLSAWRSWSVRVVSSLSW